MHRLGLILALGLLTAGAAYAQTPTPCTPAPDASVQLIRDLDPSPTHSSIAQAVNARSAVVGYRYSEEDPVTHAFVWTPAAAIWPLGIAWDINDRGDVVGQKAGRAVWWVSGKPLELPQLSGVRGVATASERTPHHCGGHRRCR